MMSGGATAPRCAHPADRGAHLLGAERRAVDAQLAVLGARLAQQRGGGRHAGLGGGLGAAHAAQLGLVLRPPAPGELLDVGAQLDAVRAQAVGQRDRQLRRHHGDVQLEARAEPRAQLELDLRARHPGRDEVVEAELVPEHELDVGRDAGDPVALEQVRQHHPAVAALGVQERVADRERDLVAEGGRALGVAVDENGGARGARARAGLSRHPA
jgi:hypothetical protein